MKDWQEQLSQLEQKLQQWNGRYDTEMRRMLKERGLTGLFRRPSPAELEAVSQDARQLVGDEELSEAFLFFDAIGDHFMSVGPQERGLIRARVGASNAMFEYLWSYVVQTAELLKSADDGERLRHGLAGLAIDDGRAEYNQMLDTMASIWSAAKRAGLDPKPYFEAAAEVANRGASGGGTFLATELKDFDQKPYIRSRIGA